MTPNLTLSRLLFYMMVLALPRANLPGKPVGALKKSRS